jgi:hypothetical protein
MPAVRHRALRQLSVAVNALARAPLVGGDPAALGEAVRPRTERGTRARGARLGVVATPEGSPAPPLPTRRATAAARAPHAPHRAHACARAARTLARGGTRRGCLTRCFAAARR